MKCSRARSLLSQYLDGTLPATQMRAVSDHMHQCTECSSEYRNLKEVQMLLTNLGRRSAPADLPLRLRIAISREPARKRATWLSSLAKSIGLVGTPKSSSSSNEGDKDAFQLEQLQVADGRELFALAVVDNRLKAVALETDGTYRYLDEAFNLHNIIYVASAETLVLKKVIEELEWLMNDSTSTETDFQHFFERNSWLILNDSYKEAHTTVRLNVEENQLVNAFGEFGICLWGRTKWGFSRRA